MFACIVWATGCSDNDTQTPNMPNPDAGVTQDAAPADAGESPADAGFPADMGVDGGVTRAELPHRFPSIALRANEEASPCVSWTLNNEEAIYVETVQMSNSGWFHHSNWFVVPEENYPGDDGIWDCGSRGFSEVGAALAGTVLFAQSTQAQVEAQTLGEGVVIKIPARHKVVGSLHLLNLTPRAQVAGLIMNLSLIHPRDVQTVVAPFRLLYRDLQIAAQAESRFTSECDLAAAVAIPFDIKLYYLLPHYHELGNYFRVEILSDDERNGDVVFELNGYNAQPNGMQFDPPLELSGIRGFRFTCGFDNPRDEVVGWGIGDQEMCEALFLADVPALYDARSLSGNTLVGQENGIFMNEAPCQVTGFPKNMRQTPPTEEEIAAELYVPPTAPSDVDVPPVLECQPYDMLPASGDRARLSIIQEEVLVPSCTFSSCHDGENPAAGLDLRTPNLYPRLLGHTVGSNTDLALIAPGEPDASWLFQRISQCEPTDRDGNPVGRMPFGSATLLDDDALGLVRDWIANGALDN